MKLALAQLNPTVGDIAANSRLILQSIGQAAEQGADLVIFSELVLTGYPPKDLLLKPRFIADNQAALQEIAAQCQSIGALIGFVCEHTGPTGKQLHNAAALIQNGRVVATYYKQLLPTYDVFDEQRYFAPAKSQQVVEFMGRKIGLTICEDIWQTPDQQTRRLYEINPFEDLARAGVDLIVNMSASPFVINKHAFRIDLFGRQCRQHRIPLVYVNQTGGNDDLIFDGASCAFGRNGELIAQARDFEPDLLLVDIDRPEQNSIASVKSDIASVHDALVLGLRDYLRKCGFRSVVLGLSGGIDSAVTAAIAVEALGADKVTGVAMPSRYSSDHSVNDARDLAGNLGIPFHIIPIETAHCAMEETLTEIFTGLESDITEENIQARLRGNILMAISNKFGSLLLTTGNKSELAVGYCTMYGDMAGGLAVISDVPKIMVYRLANYINREREVIPISTISKPPSAELKPGQVDQDSLPPYEILDDILERYVEQEQSFQQIVDAGFERDVVGRIIRLVDRNEYKRKQAAPGLKVTSRAFGTGRRMPIAQNYTQK